MPLCERTESECEISSLVGNQVRNLALVNVALAGQAGGGGSKEKTTELHSPSPMLRLRSRGTFLTFVTGAE